MCCSCSNILLFTNNYNLLSNLNYHFYYSIHHLIHIIIILFYSIVSMYTTSLFVSFHMAPMPLAPCHVQPTTNTFGASICTDQMQINPMWKCLASKSIFTCYPHCSLLCKLRHPGRQDSAEIHKELPRSFLPIHFHLRQFRDLQGLEKKSSWSNHVICSLGYRNSIDPSLT